MSIEIIQGDILLTKIKCIVHQCNCVTTTSKGLANAIFNKYKEANDYKTHKHGKPGTIHIHNIDNKIIINMFAQRYPGRSRSDGQKTYREMLFQKCLDQIGQSSISREIAFPYKIGCGLAGGNWKNYLKMISNFAKKYNVEVSILKKM